MRCPFCQENETKVTDSRLVGDGLQIRRRRECLGCQERFTTYETVELSLPRVVKHDGSRQHFDENKLRKGLLRAIEKRPVDTEQVESAISRIKQRLLALGEREVPSGTIGEWVMDELRKLDDVAYVRFASVYRRFEDVSAFQDEIERLHKKIMDDKQT